jgi:signal peptidase I
MEYRLLVIGVLMGAYAWACRRRKHEGREPAVLHAAFWGLAAFSVALVAMMSFQDRPRYAVFLGLAVPIGEVLPALIAGAALAALGYRHGLSRLKDAEARRGMLHEDLEWADTVFSSALMASLLMMFVVQAFKIPSGSMERTLLIGDQLFVNKFMYGLKVPFTDKRALAVRAVRRGDILVFRFPTEDPAARHCGTLEYGNDLIKRVVGLPGETVEVRGGHVLIDGKPLGDEPYAQWTGTYHQDRPEGAGQLSPEQYQQIWQDRRLEEEPPGVNKDYFGPVAVPPRSYFMMGDNRDFSCDSRYWGPVPEGYVKGKAWFIYWPPTRLGPL